MYFCILNSPIQLIVPKTGDDRGHLAPSPGHYNEINQGIHCFLFI